MERTSSDSVWRPPDWFIRLCRLPWKTRKFIFGNIGLNIVLCMLVSWLFTHENDLKGMHIEWIFQNRWWFLSTILCWAVLTLLSGVFYLVPLNAIDTKRVEKEILRSYLKRMCLETELLTLKGIPAGLISESVQLDEVFIPLQFRPNRPKVDYPLTDRELDYFRELRKSGKLSIEQERALVEAEYNWHLMLMRSDRIRMTDLWQRLTNDRPVAVIQGAPGMGKSTFSERLVLHMARKGLGQPDPQMPSQERFVPTLIPILLRLGEYAAACAEATDLTLEEYLKRVLMKFKISKLDIFMIEKCLKAGQCLMILDGLDEISKLDMREQVQDAIKDFINTYRNTSTQTNRFIITSRIAGYDLKAFPAYIHFTIAELNPEQIDEFLPRWCRANMNRSLRQVTYNLRAQNEVLSREVEQRIQELSLAINDKDYPALRELAENPLLLTLLTVMQLNSIELPRQRVELYSVITSTMLENRNIAKKLTPILEGEAINRLGPLAFEMQRKDSLATEQEVMQSLQNTIKQYGGTPEEIAKEANEFLIRIRERGGLFVQRTADYFGFLHRTFQEYFVARYMLNEIELAPEVWIPRLVGMARQRDALWREPFLLAVAFQSKVNKREASQILRELLNSLQDATREDREFGVLLAAECVIEAKALSIETNIEKLIGNKILQTYKDAIIGKRFTVCVQIERIIQRWLVSLPEEAYRPPILEVLYDAITNTTRRTLQQTTLTLLTMIAQRLDSCSLLIFQKLIPPLLALADLPAIGIYRPHNDVAATADLNVADLALSVLCLIGKQGPTGYLLKDIQQYFLNAPNHLSQLACLSLEKNLLLTPVMIPSSKERLQSFISLCLKWMELGEHQTLSGSEREKQCIMIHEGILNVAEGGYYPSAVHLLKMYHILAADPGQFRQQTWQTYLLDELSSCNYISYLDIIFLGMEFLSKEQVQKNLIILVLEHYEKSGTRVQQYAQHALATISSALRDRMDKDFESIREEQVIKNFQRRREVENLRDSRRLRTLRILTHVVFQMAYLNDALKIGATEPIFTSIRKEFLEYNLTLYTSHLYDHLSYKRIAIWIKYFLNSDVSKSTMKRLALHSKNVVLAQSEQVELLSILLGRIIQFQLKMTENEDRSDENEIQQIVEIVLSTLISTNNDEICEYALDILRYLPANSGKEISYVLSLAERNLDVRVQEACADSLYYSRPRTSEDWTALEHGKTSNLEYVKQTVEERLQLGDI